MFEDILYNSFDILIRLNLFVLPLMIDIDSCTYTDTDKRPVRIIINSMELNQKFQ